KSICGSTPKAASRGKLASKTVIAPSCDWFLSRPAPSGWQRKVPENNCARRQRHGTSQYKIRFIFEGKSLRGYYAHLYWRCRKGAVMGVRVLIVEDDDAIADYLVRGLREEGYVVERAADGNEGWLCLKHQAWDVVLLDWSLPATDGLTLLERFRQANQ